MKMIGALAMVLVSADARAQISYWLERTTDERAQSYPLEIVAEATPDAAESRRFVLISSIPEGSVDDALQERASAYIRLGLTAADFVPVESVAEADIAVAFSLGFGASELRYMAPVPVTAWPSTGTGYETRELDLQNMSTSLGAPPTPVYPNRVADGIAGIEVTGVSSARPSIPTAPPLDASQMLPLGRPVFVELVAFDLQAYRETEQPVRLWRTVVNSISSSNDVDMLLSAMLAGGQKYFGTQHDEMRYDTVSDSSKAARFIRGETERHGPPSDERGPGNPASRR